MLATSFHPELTSNTSFHKYFLKAIAGLVYDFLYSITKMMYLI